MDLTYISEVFQELESDSLVFDTGSVVLVGTLD